ncbi:MAG TPA: MlaD family protein [Acetobacteraceae bacterium]|nr:MlaD family protein [Acetobacteraceae bacterium]
MNEIDRPNTVADVRRRRRIPAIWIIPLLAIAVGAWLAWDTYSKKGPTVTISFESAEGLVAGQSQLKFKEMTLGTVTKLTLSRDHARVIATVSTTNVAAPLLTDRTVFWVVKPRLFAGNISGLGTLLSGSYIGMLPGEDGGKPQRDYTGLEDPPVLQSGAKGRTFLVKADRLGSMNLGSPVIFRDITVGQVLGWDLGDMAANATIHVFVRAPFDQYVHDDTRFWDASGFSVKLGGAGVQVQVQSLRAILLGGIGFDNPRVPKTGPATRPSASNHVFPLFPDQEEADASIYGQKLHFVAYFPGSVRGLAPGADVTFHGLKIGEVRSVDLTYSRAQDAIVAPVHFTVEPERFAGIGKRIYSNPAEGVDTLVRQGLRATLQSASLLTGQQLVAMEIDPDAPPAKVTMEGDTFVMPTTDNGGLQGLTASATDLLNKVNTIPFAAIGRSLVHTLQGADTVVNGPQVKQVLTELASSLGAVQNTLKQVDSGLSPGLRQLPAIAARLQLTMANANRLLLSMEAGYGDNTKLNRDLDRMLVQAQSAVESIRSLTDLLTRHPEVLIRGRTNQGIQ